MQLIDSNRAKRVAGLFKKEYNSSYTAFSLLHITRHPRLHCCGVLWPFRLSLLKVASTLIYSLCCSSTHRSFSSQTYHHSFEDADLCFRLDLSLVVELHVGWSDS
jgi:hypothetical protein